MKLQGSGRLVRITAVGAALTAATLPMTVRASAAPAPSTVTASPAGSMRAPIGQAPTPPMGWASWNAFGVNITEARVLASAQALLDTGLAKAGYRRVNVDDGWWLKRRQSDGRLQVRTNLFPSAAVGGAAVTSLRPFTDRIHAMGLKPGIYSDIGRNACSQGWTPDNPNLPEGTVAEREVGLYGHARQDITLFFKAWNFDYIKVDGCGLSAFGADKPLVRSGRYREFTPLVVDANFNQTDIAKVRALYEEVRDALAAVRPAGNYVYSLCLWGAANVRSWGGRVGTMWRTSNDIDPTWGRMLHNFDTVSTRELYAGPGRWNDPDMLEVGNGFFDADHLTQARTHMSLWAIEAAPLIIGTDLAKASRAVLDVLRAPEVIAVDQDPAGNQGVLAYTDDERQIIVKTLADGRKAVALFNRTAMPTAVTLTAAHLKMADGAPIALRDLWARHDLPAMTGPREFKLAPFETVLLSAAGRSTLPTGYYLSDRPGRIEVIADGLPALEADPIIHRMIDPYHPSTTSDGNRPSYAGWGAPRADATPYNETIRVANVPYRYGLGAVANSRIAVGVPLGAQRFEAMVGVDDSTRGKTADVVFELWGNGRLIALSSPRRFGQTAERLMANIAGIGELQLVTRQSGADPSGNVVVAWGAAQIG